MGSHSRLPGDLPDLGIEPESFALQADLLSSEPPGKPQKSRGLSNFPIYLFPEANSVQAFLDHLGAVKGFWKNLIGVPLVQRGPERSGEL